MLINLQLQNHHKKRGPFDSDVAELCTHTHLPLQLPLLVQPLCGEVAKILGELCVFVSGFLHVRLRSRLTQEINKQLPLHQAGFGILG